MKGRRLRVRGAGSRSGRGSVAIGTYFSLPGGGVGFLGLLLPRRYFAPAAVAELEKLWKRQGLADRLTVMPVLRPSVS